MVRVNERTSERRGTENCPKGKLRNTQGNNSLWAIQANFAIVLSYLCKRILKTWTSCYNIIIKDKVVIPIWSDQVSLMMEQTPLLCNTNVTLGMTLPSDNRAQVRKKTPNYFDFVVRIQGFMTTCGFLVQLIKLLLSMSYIRLGQFCVRDEVQSCN